MRFRSPLSMPKPRKSRSRRSQLAANLTGPCSSASGAGPSQISANSMTINYTATPTETLRLMLSQRHLNQTGPRRVLITRLQESDSSAANTVASIHKNYRLPSVASHLSNSQIAAITNGEYVDLASLLSFSSLLRDRVNSNLKLQVGNEDLTIPLPSPAQRSKITSIDRWLDAFTIFSSVVLYSYPSRGLT